MALDGWLLAHARVSSKPHQRVKLDDKMTFFHQLSTLVCSGTPLLQALRICAEENQSRKLQRVLQQVANRVAAGSSLHAATAEHSQIFEPHWIAIIRTGEITGQMGVVLVELNQQIREARETRRKVMGALLYPLILLIVAAVSMTIMLWFVVPTFAGMFRELGAELPAMTQFVVNASTFLVDYGLYVVAGLALVIVAFRRFLKTDSGRRRLTGMALAIPLVGEFLVQRAMYRFAANLGLLLKSGIPMLETLDALAGVFHTSPLYRDALLRVQGSVAAGRPLATSLEEAGLFTTMTTNMVRIGEESGQLAAVMEQIAPYYKEKTEAFISRAIKLLEPLIIVGMGAAVAGLLLAIYLPMFDMAGKIH